MFLLRASMAAFMYGMFSSEERKFLMSSSRFKNVSKFLSRSERRLSKWFHYIFLSPCEGFPRYWAHTRNQVLPGHISKECYCTRKRFNVAVYIAFYLGRLDLISCLLVYVVRESSAVMLPIISKIFFTKISWSNFF